VVVYLLFSGIYRVRISGMFLQWMCLRSIPGVVVSTEGAVYSTPDSQCLECYIPFIHSRHNAKDRSLGVGRDISGVKPLSRDCRGSRCCRHYVWRSSAPHNHCRNS